MISIYSHNARYTAVIHADSRSASAIPRTSNSAAVGLWPAEEALVLDAEVAVLLLDAPEAVFLSGEEAASTVDA